MKILSILLERANEKSTWAGIIGLAGLSFSAELNEAVIQALIAFVSVVAILVKERK